MKVLIVDDDKQRSSKLAAYLSDCGVVSSGGIDIAFDVRKARELLKAKYYDALILDVVLPKREGEGRVGAENGVSLLAEVSRSAFLKKPEKIIGITAHVESIGDFREEFERCCSVVVPADGASSSWRTKISDALEYTFGSKISRESVSRRTVVISVHGIRTYGEWQQRLRAEVERTSDTIEFFNYKYGYFSSLSLMTASVRNVEVMRLCENVRAVAEQFGSCRIVVFSHSFGTYLVVNAAKKLMVAGLDVDLVLVLCGSVLPERYDWSFLSGSRINVINECGSSDVVLYASKLFVPGLGMAGRVGFHGFNHSGFVNRFYKGGHSLYFDGDDFLRKRWVPLMSGAASVDIIDERGSPNVIASSMDSLVGFLASSRMVILVSLSIVAVFLFIKILFF